MLTAGDVDLDPFRVEVLRAGRRVPVTRKEFAVLHVLMSARGGTVSAEQLSWLPLNTTWCSPSASPTWTTRTLLTGMAGGRDTREGWNGSDQRRGQGAAAPNAAL